MSIEREIVKKLFESKHLDEKTYTVGDTQYWKRNGKTYKWTSSGGRVECSEDEYMKAISGGSNNSSGNSGAVKNTDAKDDKSKEPDKSKPTTDKPKYRLEPKNVEDIGAYFDREFSTKTPDGRNIFNVMNGEEDTFRSQKAKDTAVRAVKSFVKAKKRALNNPNYRDSLYTKDDARSQVERGEAILDLVNNVPVKS